MINFGELNECIEENKKQMNKDTDYDFWEKITKEMASREKELQKLDSGITPVILFTKEEGIGIVLKFFKSLGNEQWYNMARDIILAQDKNRKINIYDIEKVTDFTEKDEDGFYKYSSSSDISFSKGAINKSSINIPLYEKFQDVYEHIPKDKITLENIYDIIHEISHNFDYETSDKNKEARRLCGEITTFCFEEMLGKYLSENSICEEKLITKSQRIKRVANSFKTARIVYAKLKLIKLKQEYGNVSNENLREFLKNNNLNDIDLIKETLEIIMNDEENIDFAINYPIAQIATEGFMKTYNTDKKKAIEALTEYCESIKNGDSNKALELIGFPKTDKEISNVINSIVDRLNDKEREIS